VKILPAVILATVLLTGCGGKEPGSTQLTKGKLRLGCDEAVLPLVRREVSEFTRLYTEASIRIDSGGARTLISDFANDSIRVIVCARDLNKEERDALSAAKVQFQEYKFARTAVAVIEHPGLPTSRFRVGELDTVFSGGMTRWPGKNRLMVELAVGGLNSSVNEVFRKSVLTGGGFDRAAKPFTSSLDLLEYVARTPGAIGIIGLDWLKENQGMVNVAAVASPAMRPDSTYAPQEYYSPAPAYVYLGYYPLYAPVFIYTREIERDLADGFIAFLTSAAGQKVVQNGGLVPVTMPVRLVHLTSE
jgi:phosphate transport system substrate-binding protein